MLKLSMEQILLTKTHKRKPKKLFRGWLKFLNYVNEEARNTELLRDYFFHQVAKAPKIFYEFLNAFKEELMSAKSTKKKRRMSKKYLDIFSFLCGRFGLYQEKNFLDDLCFSILHPHEYKIINSELAAQKKQSRELIEKIHLVLQKFLKNHHFSCKVGGRYKGIYSIYKKLQKKKSSDLSKLKDIFAFRIIVSSDEESECFKILSLLHDNFLPLSERFKDYISVPKINGYQSLHTGLKNVLEDFDMPVEIQIRTKSMHEFAEQGVAAHWAYSHRKKSKLVTAKGKRLMNYLSHLSHEQEKMVYFFSYQGDIFRLPENATVSDFANHVHSELGKRAESAIVNGKTKPLGYVIQEADRIQIIEKEADSAFSFLKGLFKNKIHYKTADATTG